MWNTALDEALGLPAISEKSKEVLQNCVIDESQPGTILRDFTTYVEFIGAEGRKTKSKYYMLPQKELNAINERMSRPVKHRLKRAQQRSFPHLHGLFLILRASGMGAGKGTPPNGRLAIDTELVARWLDMNPTERYFNLLESWLIYGDLEIIGEEGGWCYSSAERLLNLWRKLRKRKTVITDDRDNYVLYETTEMATAALMQLFGWLNLEFRDPKEGEGVKPAMVERTPLGDAMIEVLAVSHLSSLTAHDATQAETLRQSFQLFFPEWQQTLALPEEPFREGEHTWHVSLGEPWRRIVTPADMDLDDLAMTILDAFDFDDDHLYCFELTDRRGRNLRIACPYEEDSPECTEGFLLGNVPLPVGGTMTFVFDYGDEWKFDVKLENVSEKKSRRKNPKVIASRGEAPAQYDWDEW